MHRDKTGEGQRVDIPMFETMASFMMGDHMGGLTYDPPLDKGGYGRHLSPDRRPYQTSDGYICAMVYNDKQWKSFLKHVGREELFDDPRFRDLPAAHPAYRHRECRTVAHLQDQDDGGMGQAAR